jgi:hypothetical protein
LHPGCAMAARHGDQPDLAQEESRKNLRVGDERGEALLPGRDLPTGRADVARYRAEVSVTSRPEPEGRCRQSNGKSEKEMRRLEYPVDRMNLACLEQNGRRVLSSGLSASPKRHLANRAL